MKIQLESISNLVDELEPLIKLHWEQIELNQDKIKLKPDWDQYKAIDKLGMIRTYTVRDNKELVGYFIAVYMKALHHADHVFANCDAIYIRPDKRKGSIGHKLIKYAEKDLSKIGVSMMTINVKTHAPFDRLLNRLGFKFTEKIYTKYLGD